MLSENKRLCMAFPTFGQIPSHRDQDPQAAVSCRIAHKSFHLNPVNGCVLEQGTGQALELEHLVSKTGFPSLKKGIYGKS